MAHHYIGTTKSGQIVSRKSTNPHFTHAAVREGWKANDGRLPNFSTSRAGAERNYGTNYGVGVPEVVEVREVTAKEYKAAKGK
jgi:hypothetical protein